MLSGLQVVEIGQYVAAPLAATIFADLGAEVSRSNVPEATRCRRPRPLRRLEPGQGPVELDLRSADG